MGAQEVPYPLLKRLTDRALATILILVLAPVFAVVLAVVAGDMLLSARDRGSWLYRERRVSRGRQFDLLKFRTLREEVLVNVRRRGAYARSFEADAANLTWAGRHVLKPWYLDELPQLVNVLLGHMSLVGPRPWPPAAVAEQIERGHDYRNRVQAGWTGPSQIEKGGPETGPGPDLAYIEACRSSSSWRLVGHDLILLARSLRVLIRRGGLSD